MGRNPTCIESDEARPKGATLIDSPRGQIGRPSRSFTLAESLALLDAARGPRLNAYVVLSLATGIRTEEARELHWEHVDLDGDPGAARGLCRRQWPSGIRCGKAATPRQPSRGGHSRCPRLPCMLCESTASGRPKTGSRPDPYGRTTAWSSPRLLARPWTPLTCAVSSARSPRRPGLAPTGHRAICGTPSSP